MIISRYILSLSLFFLLAAPADSQNPKKVKSNAFTIHAVDTVNYARAMNGAITVIVDRHSGRFAAMKNDGTPILFFRSGGMTSYTNVFCNGAAFTNNSLISPQSPLGTRTMSPGTIVAAGDRVTMRTSVEFIGARLDVSQEFIPSLDQDYAFVQIKTTVKNVSTSPVPAGTALMLDLFVGTEDRVAISLAGQPVTAETEWRGSAIPSEWFGNVTLLPVRIKAQTRGAGLTPPDRFVIGRWQYNGYLGAASWNYTASGLRMIDNAVWMQWDERILQPGESITTTTNYGYLANYSAELTCDVDSIQLDVNSNSYMPNPFSLRARVRNTGDVDIANLSLTLDPLPPAISLAPGETMTKVVAIPIPTNATSEAVWKLVASDVTSVTKVNFAVTLATPAQLRTRCTTSATLPAIRSYRAALDCGAPIQIFTAPGGQAYANNPFFIPVDLLNTGTGDLDSLTATLTLPPRLQLVSGSLTRLLTPLTLPPGDVTSMLWQVRASTDTAAANVPFIVTVTNRKIGAVTCTQYVSLPAIKPVQLCMDNGVSTKGTEFWFAMVPNSQGNSAPLLRLNLVSSDTTTVTVRRPGLNITTTHALRPGVVTAVDLEDPLNNPTPEVVQKLGINITSSKPISAYFANFRERHSDATMLLPLHALGKEHTTVGYNWTDPEEHFMICATEDRTTVTILPIAGTSSGNHAPGVPFTITLNKGESYYVWCELGGKFGGLTGSSVSADKPIAVMSGGVSGHIPYPSPLDFAYLNPHFDQVIPSDLLGTEYVTVPFRSRKNGDTFKFVATQNATTFSINSGAPIALSQRGDVYETQLAAASHIVSDKPLLVAQFANSAEYDEPDGHYADGSMVILSPTNRFMTCHTFPAGFGERFDSTFVNIVVPDGAQRSVTVAGKAAPDTMFHRVGTSSYFAASILLARGLQSIETSDARGIGVIVYGFEYHDAFTFNSGFTTVKKAKPGRTEESMTNSKASLCNSPNPFNPTTRIRFTVPGNGSTTQHVLLTIMDRLGRAVAVLIDGERMSGEHSIEWDASNFPSGIYRCTVQLGATTLHTNMLLVK